MSTFLSTFLSNATFLSKVADRIINRPTLGILANDPEETRLMRRAGAGALVAAITLMAVQQGAFGPLISRLSKVGLQSRLGVV